MDSFLSRYRNVAILAIVLTAQVLGLAAQVKRPGNDGPVRLIRIWASTLFTPLEEAAVHSQGFAGRIWRNYVWLRGLSSENAQLRNENERLRLEQVRLVQDAAQAQRLQALLRFKEQIISQTVAAQVIGTAGSEASRIVYIDKGHEDGITHDQAVITPEGIVGKVLDSSRGTSRVLLITDPSSGVGAILTKSRLQGVLKGTQSGEVVLDHIMSDEKVELGDPVITSGGDHIFPKGLPIGTVTKSSPGSDLFLNVRVKPAAAINKLEEVLVITKIEQKEADVDTTTAGPIRAADILAQRLPTIKVQPPGEGGTGIPPSTAELARQQKAAAAATGIPPSTAQLYGRSAPKPATPSNAAGAKTSSSAAGQSSAPKAVPPSSTQPAATNGVTTPAPPKKKPATNPAIPPATPPGAPEGRR